MLVEVIVSNNLWLHYIGKQNRSTLDSVSGLSFSWSQYDEDLWRFTLGAKVDGVWQQHHVDTESDSEVSLYDTAMELVKGVFGAEQ